MKHWIVMHTVSRSVAAIFGVHESFEADMYQMTTAAQHEEMETKELITHSTARWKEIMQTVHRHESIGELEVQFLMVVCKIDCRNLYRWIKVAQAIMPEDRVQYWKICRHAPDLCNDHHRIMPKSRSPHERPV